LVRAGAANGTRSPHRDRGDRAAAAAPARDHRRRARGRGRATGAGDRARAARFLRARGKSIPPFPDFHVLPVQPEPEPEVAPALPTTTREMDLYRPGDPVAPGTAGDPDDDVATAAWEKVEPEDEMIPVEVVAPTGPIITVPDD